MKQVAYDMLYLTACAVNGIKPEKNIIKAMDMDKLFEICQFHSLTSIVCMALESTGIKPSHKWIETKAKAIRKVMLHDVERQNILSFMEENGIWYMPLKGVILKELYPKSGMRQMTDNDILYDETYQHELRNFMVGRGYKPKHIGKGCDDVYMKEPVYNFEMHRKLFEHSQIPEITAYYSDPKRLIASDGKSSFGRTFTDEDFYIYITAHEYKHYVGGGTGIRSLLDCYVYMRKYKDKLNFGYISSELEKMSIAGYEEKSRSLAEKIFSSTVMPELSEDERYELEYYLFSGTYGTQKNMFENRITKFMDRTSSSSKIGYIRYRIFPPISFYKEHFPFCHKTKVLIPFAWGYRLIRGATTRRKRIFGELSTVNKILK